MFQPNGAFLGSSNLPMRSLKMSPKRHDQIAKSREQALAAFSCKKAEIDTMLLACPFSAVITLDYARDDMT
jgi:hypothetical protein